MKSALILALTILVSATAFSSDEIVSLAPSGTVSLCSSIKNERESYQLAVEKVASLEQTKADKSEIEKWKKLRDDLGGLILSHGNIQAATALFYSNGPRIISLKNTKTTINGKKLEYVELTIPGESATEDILKISGTGLVSVRARFTLAGLCPFISAKGAPSHDEILDAATKALGSYLN